MPLGPLIYLAVLLVLVAVIMCLTPMRPRMRKVGYGIIFVIVCVGIIYLLTFLLPMHSPRLE